MEAVGLSLRNPNPPKQPQKTALPTNGPKGLASAKGSFCILSHDSQSRAASVHTLMRENMWNITLSWDRLTPLSLNGQGASGDLQSPALLLPLGTRQGPFEPVHFPKSERLNLAPNPQLILASKRPNSFKPIGPCSPLVACHFRKAMLANIFGI